MEKNVKASVPYSHILSSELRFHACQAQTNSLQLILFVLYPEMLVGSLWLASKSPSRNFALPKIRSSALQTTVTPIHIQYFLFLSDSCTQISRWLRCFDSVELLNRRRKFVHIFGSPFCSPLVFRSSLNLCLVVLFRHVVFHRRKCWPCHGATGA